QMAHRGQLQKSSKLLKEVDKLLKPTRESLKEHPDIYYGGFLQAAEKEYAEASIFFSIVKKQPLPAPQDLKVGESSYLCGMGEAIGEMRRYILDSIRKDKLADCERMLSLMDELYYFLFSFDYPEPLIKGLRRTTDSARGIIERTRADVTNAICQKRLEEKLSEK
ncbi:MAG: haloacid dehalogenase, partial [Candidatus Omnitrophica bacterium]|nr:haloacid dehalogenase [Candidatus Omnitrophota bacterium]